MEPTLNPSGTSQKEIPRSSPNNWSVLHSLFNLPAEDDSTPEPESPTASEQIAGNWGTLKSLFGVTQVPTGPSNPPTNPPIDPPTDLPTNPPSDPVSFWWRWYWALHTNGTIDPKPLDFWLGNFAYFLATYYNPFLLPVHEQIKTTLAAADRAKRHAEAASWGSRTAQRAAETAKLNAQLAYRATEAAKLEAEAANLNTQTAQRAVEAAKIAAQADHHSIQLTKTQVEATKLDVEQAQQTVAAVKLNAQAAHTTIETAKKKVEAAEVETEAAKLNAQTAYQSIEIAKIQAETAKLNAEKAQQAAEIAKKQTEITQAKTEAILKKIGGSTGYLTSLKPLLAFLAKHKFQLLLAGLALIPLFLLLHKTLNPSKPPLSSIYVDPVSGNDNNTGTPADPFKTLPQALQHATSQSNIYLNKGEYNIDRSLAIPAGAAIIIQPFNDINGHWAAPFIRALAAQKLIAGYPDGSFRPDTSLTRAEYATLLTRVFNLPETQTAKTFIDVSPDFWANSAIQTTYSKGFLKGFPEGNFNPNDNVQRVQVIAALINGLGLPPTNLPNALSVYQDKSSIPGWATTQTATATIENLVVNYPNLQTLNPIQSATRAETIAMIYQALVKQGKMPVIESPYLVKP